MGRQSSIDRLPEKIRESLNEWLRDPAITQEQAVARTQELVDQINEGLPEDQHVQPPSKSAVNRYAVKMDKVGEKLRQSREVADMWIGKLGSQPQGQIGNMITEMLRSLAFDLALKLQEDELNEESIPGVIESANQLSLMAQRVEKATSENFKREQAIREEERKRAAEEAAEAAETSGRSAGLSDEGVAAMRKAIMEAL